MGCCHSRTGTQLKLEETILLPFEQSLSFYKYTFQETQPHFLQYGELPISYLQLRKIFNDLSIPYLQIADFYDQFDKISLFQLQTLILLLCKGEVSKKLTFWFNLYDEGQKSISRTTFQEMLENLLKVTFDYICGYIVKNNLTNLHLAKYYKFIRSGKSALIDSITDKIMEDKNDISTDEFVRKCTENYGKDLFSTVFLRDQAYLIGENGGIQGKKPVNMNKFKKNLPLLDFEGLDDNSSSFEIMDSGPQVHRKFKSASLFSAGNTKNQKENFRYIANTSRRCSLLEPEKRLAVEFSEKEAEKEKKEKRQENVKDAYVSSSKAPKTFSSIKRTNNSPS